MSQKRIAELAFDPRPVCLVPWPGSLTTIPGGLAKRWELEKGEGTPELAVSRVSNIPTSNSSGDRKQKQEPTFGSAS